MKLWEGAEKFITRSFIICATKYNYSYQDEEDEMGRACSPNGEEEEHL
jgi:hypothetical protein